MTQRRKYQLISEVENWTLPFFKASSGFCPLYSPSIFETGAALSHGLDLSQERKYRILIIKYMFEAGDTLLLPYNTICIAITYFHKFFQSISIRAHDPYYISTSCLFTAGKQEETRIRLDHCAKFLYDYKQRNPNHNFNHNNHTNTVTRANYKHDLERICKKLAIAELLCTQINKFNYNINLPFDYLLPIICEWKSVYIPHQTNTQTLKYIYCLNAFKFIKESFFIPINIIIPPQKIAIVCMELSLRLNYAKYQSQQEEINKPSVKMQIDREFRYIDPPLEWYRIFYVNDNEQDLKDEINLIANEIVAAIQDFTQFGLDVTCDSSLSLDRLRQWRKGTLKTDKVHQQLIAQQVKHENSVKNNVNNMIEYPYNCSNDGVKMDELMQKHRYKIQKQAELSLAFNNQTISPASLHPHAYFTLYPLKIQCFSDVDEQYEADLIRVKKVTVSKKKHKKSRMSDDDSSSDAEIASDDDSKSNAVQKRKRKRSRSESVEREKEKENHRKKRRIETNKNKNKKKHKYKYSDEESESSEHRISRKDRKHSHSHSHSHSSSSSSSHSRKREKRNHKKKRVRSRSRSRSSSSSVSCEKRDKKSKKKERKSKTKSKSKRDRDRYTREHKREKRKKKNNIPRYEGGYFTPDPRHVQNRHRYHHSGGGVVGVGVSGVGVSGMEVNINGLHDRYYEGDDDMFEDNNMTKLQSFDYGLTPTKYNKKVEVNVRMDMDMDMDVDNEQEDGECKDNNEEKTQRHDNEEPVSPLLKALKSNKSALYTNMLLPSRKDK